MGTVAHQPRTDDERLFVDIVDALHVGLHVWELERPDDDPGDMRLLYANAATLTASGIPPETIIGGTLAEIFPPLMETGIPEIYVEVALGGAARSLGDVVYGDDRVEDSVFAASVFPLPGRRVGVAFSDVTEDRRSVAREAIALESMSDALFKFDDDWTLTYLNPQTEALLHQKPDELLGRNYWDVFPASAGSKFESEYRRALRDQVTVEFEEYYPPLHTWFTVRAYPQPSGLAVYFQDITSRKRLEEQLRQSQRLESIGQLAGGIAHDFNNLLTVIDGYTSLASSKAETDPGFVERALGEISGASQRAATLTSKLLTFSRMKPLELTVADVNETVSAALDLVQPLIGENIAVHRSLRASRGHVYAEAAEIEQVIVNLVINARDAMKEGGTIFVATECVELDSASALGLAPGWYVSVTVQDCGVGMDTETQGKIFDPFFTTKPVGEGTGLGLSTAYGTIVQSGGRIEVASVPDEGTTFTILLPRSEAALSAPDPRRLPAPDGAGGERVLVVEDDDDVRQLMHEVLTSCGYDVAHVGNPREALALCADQRFDLLVTDLVMPGSHGTALAAAVVAAQPDMSVLFISGYKPETIGPLALEGSETAFLAKPFSLESLSRTVRAVLDRRRSYDGS